MVLGSLSGAGWVTSWMAADRWLLSDAPQAMPTLANVLASCWFNVGISYPWFIFIWSLNYFVG
jgi:hypothetical protein